MNTPPSLPLSRRHFLNRASSAAAGVALIHQLPIERSAFAGGASDTLRVALVGCGGRGSGAADQALNADTDLKLVAMADVQDEKLQTGLGALKKAHPDHVDVPRERQFLPEPGARHLGRDDQQFLP